MVWLKRRGTVCARVSNAAVEIQRSSWYLRPVAMLFAPVDFHLPSPIKPLHTLYSSVTNRARHIVFPWLTPGYDVSSCQDLINDISVVSAKAIQIGTASSSPETH